jgi:hypothetical protein
MKRKKIFIISLLAGVFLGYWAIYLLGKSVFKKEELLSPQPEIKEDEISTLTPTPSPTMTPTPTPKPTTTPTPIPTPPPTPQPPVSSEQIHAFIDQFAGQYNVDANILRHIAICESGLNPLAKKLTYAGLYQFAPTTWIKYRLLMGEDINPDLRFNAEEAVQTAAYVLSINHAYIWPSCVP